MSEDISTLVIVGCFALVVIVVVALTVFEDGWKEFAEYRAKRMEAQRAHELAIEKEKTRQAELYARPWRELPDPDKENTE